MKLTSTINLRLSEEERRFIESEMIRMQKKTGFKVSAGDVVRRCIALYKSQSESGGMDLNEIAKILYEGNDIKK